MGLLIGTANYRCMNPKPTIYDVEKVARDMISQLEKRVRALSIRLPIGDNIK